VSEQAYGDTHAWLNKFYFFKLPVKPVTPKHAYTRMINLPYGASKPFSMYLEGSMRQRSLRACIKFCENSRCIDRCLDDAAYLHPSSAIQAPLLPSASVLSIKYIVHHEPANGYGQMERWAEQQRA
jgi:hypothetical protein